MVDVEEWDVRDKDERRRTSALVEIARGILPKGTEISSKDINFYFIIKGEKGGTVMRLDRISKEKFGVSSPHVLDYAVRIAEEYEDYIGEAVTVKRNYE
jgi:hypothetical protein|tara:strand:+ start:423 stop:719 length:297 start_codon:yes stop_codon:yes gene_type:complete